jgi:ligand-binding sensor domain-containing protein
VGERLFHYTTKEGLVNNFIRAFLESRDGSVWIATDEGVSRWRVHEFSDAGRALLLQHAVLA